jgi:hypothetical protein
MKLLSVKALIELNTWLAALLASSGGVALLMRGYDDLAVLFALLMFAWCFLSIRARRQLDLYMDNFDYLIAKNTELLRQLKSANKDIFARDRDIAKLKHLVKTNL